MDAMETGLAKIHTLNSHIRILKQSLFWKLKHFYTDLDGENLCTKTEAFSTSTIDTVYFLYVKWISKRLSKLVPNWLHVHLIGYEKLYKNYI